MIRSCGTTLLVPFGFGVKTRFSLSWCAVVVLACGLLWASNALAEEFSNFSASTVLGRNTGIPTGTPNPFDPETVAAEEIGRVDFVVEAAFYFKNKEIFGLDEVEGETLFGVLLPLRFRYRAHERLQFEVGVVLGEDFGDSERFNVAEPLVRLGYSPTPLVHLVAGTIYPTHWIHDGLVDDTNKLRGRAEQGLQVRVDRTRLKQDLWINWRVRETGVRAEEFEIASSNQLRLFQERLWLDYHMIWNHAGGQITASDRLEQNLSFMTGGSIGKQSRCDPGCLDELRLAGRYFYSIKSGRGISRETGSGWEVSMVLMRPVSQTIRGRLHTSYFEGNQFLGERGDPLYRLDRYAQLGGSLLFRPLPGLGIETGILGQWTDSELNYTYSVNFVWGQAFATPLRKIRGDEALGFAAPY